jgi:hypothetical protein
MDEVCAITFTPVRELDRPVGFDTAHAFECESIVEWVTKRRGTNPITGQTVPSVAVASLLHPLIVEENVEHVVETQIILDNAGLVVGSERDNILRAMTVLRIHIILYTIFAHMFTYKLKGAPSGHRFMVGSVFTIAVSFVQLIRQTCEVYPVNGKCVVSHCCVIGAIVFVMAEALCPPETHTMAKFFVAHMAMLTARLMFDTSKAMF